MKIEVNTFFGNLNTEEALMINYLKKDKVNYYGGLGINTNFIRASYTSQVINGYAIIFGGRIKPINKYPSAQIVVEIVPYINKSFSSGLLKVNLGLAYQFGKANRKKDEIDN